MQMQLMAPYWHFWSPELHASPGGGCTGGHGSRQFHCPPWQTQFVWPYWQASPPMPKQPVPWGGSAGGHTLQFQCMPPEQSHCTAP